MAICVLDLGAELGADGLMDSGQLWTAITPVFVIMGVGFALRKGRVMNDAADANLMRMVVTVFYPALMLDVVLGNPALREAGNVLLPPLVGFGTIVLGYFVAWRLAPLLGLQVGAGRRTFSFTCGIFNYGYIPIPIVLALYPGRETVGVLLVHNLGVEIAFWSVGILLVSGAFTRASWRRIFNPPVVAVAVGLLINALGMADAVPEAISRAIHLLSLCAIPFGLLLSGATIADLTNDRSLLLRPLIPLAACGLRLLLLPLAFLLLARLVPEGMIELRRVMVIQAAMPAGIFPLVVARHFGGDPRVAVQVIIPTTLVSILTIPFWIQLGNWWLGIG